MSGINQRTDWEKMADEVHDLIVRLRQKPEKRGYQLSPGGILNAYREGDLTFEQATAVIDGWKDDRARLCEVILRNPCRQALQDVFDAWNQARLRPCVGWSAKDAELITRIVKVLADTEGQ